MVLGITPNPKFVYSLQHFIVICYFFSQINKGVKTEVD